MFLDVLICETLRLKKNKFYKKYTPNMYEKCQNPNFTRNFITSKPNHIFGSKFDTTVSKHMRGMC